MKKRQALWSPKAGFIATLSMESAQGSAGQSMGFAALKKWFKLRAHRSPHHMEPSEPPGRQAPKKSVR